MTLGWWASWGVLLLLQNASFTWVSRARNSGSIWYNGVASIFSNGIWMVGQSIIIVNIAQSKAPLWLMVVFYAAVCSVGSVISQWLLMKYVEKGSRKVGAS